MITVFVIMFSDSEDNYSEINTIHSSYESACDELRKLEQYNNDTSGYFIKEMFLTDKKA